MGSSPAVGPRAGFSDEAGSRQLALRRFSAWLVEEGEADTDHLLGVKAPRLDTKVVDPVTEAELRALLATCTGRDLQANPWVAVSIASEDRPYRAVVIHGRPEVLPKDRDLLLEVSTRYGEEQGRTFTDEAMAQEDRVMLKLVPDELISWDYGTSS